MRIPRGLKAGWNENGSRGPKAPLFHGAANIVLRLPPRSCGRHFTFFRHIEAPAEFAGEALRLRSGQAADATSADATALAHHLRVLGFDLVDHADFAGLAVGVFIDAEIFLGQLVDVGAGALFGDFDNAATNL